uniref:Uncharacterized protein n=1 Tax=Anguilla anguilla TaxID=7936 RepID=A0A0E9WQ05_ANGAN
MSAVTLFCFCDQVCLVAHKLALQSPLKCFQTCPQSLEILEIFSSWKLVEKLWKKFSALEKPRKTGKKTLMELLMLACQCACNICEVSL